MEFKLLLKTLAATIFLTSLVACSHDSVNVNGLTEGLNLEREAQGTFSLREPEEIAIYSGDMNLEGKVVYTTLTLIGPDQYTLEQVRTKVGRNTLLTATTGTYSFVEVNNPRNPSLILDILILRGDGEQESMSFLFLEDDSFQLITEPITYTGDPANILKRETVSF